MSIHADPRRHSLDEEEYREWQRDLRLEYAREIYEEKHPYEDMGEDESEEGEEDADSD